MTIHHQKFVKGTIILSVAGMIAKLLSACYRIPLANLTGNEGIGYYTTVYPLYTLLVSASMVGIPSAVSRLISEKLAVKKEDEAHRIYQYSMVINITFGILITLLMVMGADLLINIGGWDEGTRYVIYGLSLSPIFVSITAVFKGYFQGIQKMEPTAISQIIENLSKVFIGIGITYVLINRGWDIPLAVGGAAVGTTCGFLLSAIYITITYNKNRNKFF